MAKERKKINWSDETAALLFQKYRGAEVSGLIDTKSVEGICSEIKKSDQQKNKLFDKYTTKQMATKVTNMKKLFDDNNQPHSTSSKLNNSFNHNLQDDIDSKLEEEYINSKGKSSTPNPNTHKIPKAVMNKRKKSMVDSNDEEIPDEEEEELSDNTQDEVDEEFKYSEGSPTSITGNITKILSGELKGYHTPVRGNTKSNNNNNKNHNNNKHKYNNNDDELNNLKREILQLRNMKRKVSSKDSWCGPCLMLTTVLEQLQDDQKETISIVKIDIDKAQDIAHGPKSHNNTSLI
ncbi:hypothetical protein ACTFIR_003900 [Dictyostelium discoideum]